MQYVPQQIFGGGAVSIVEVNFGMYDRLVPKRRN